MAMMFVQLLRSDHGQEDAARGAGVDGRAESNAHGTRGIENCADTRGGTRQYSARLRGWRVDQ